MEYNSAGTLISNSRSCIEVNSAVRDMKAFKKMGTALANIIVDVFDSERNRRTMKDQEQVHCPSYGIDECTNKLCVSKK